MNEFQELEFKYKANDVGLTDFINLMEKQRYLNRIDVSSWDYYYTKDKSDDFIRFRESHDYPELTIKRKTNPTNNWHRVEVDLPLDPERINQKTIEEFVGLEGYKSNFKIYKSCFIFFQEFVNYVYYIVYNEQMVEKGRFIEVEFNKDKIIPFQETFQMIGNCTDYLKQKEQELEVLGITSKNRLKKSLFEIFRKD